MVRRDGGGEGGSMITLIPEKEVWCGEEERGREHEIEAKEER